MTRLIIIALAVFLIMIQTGDSQMFIDVNGIHNQTPEGFIFSKQFFIEGYNITQAIPPTPTYNVTGGVINNIGQDDNIELTIGLGGIAALFMLMAFFLDDKHFFLKIICLVFSFLTMFLLSHHLYSSQDYCQTVVRNQTISSGTVTYQYDRVCFDYEHTTGFTLFKMMNYFIRVIGWYIFFFIFWIILYITGFNPVEKIKNWLRR